MPKVLYTNTPSTTVAASKTAPSAGTGESWAVGSSSGFPSASDSAARPTCFFIADTDDPSETIEVTNVSGTTWSVTRGADGTTPVTHAAGATYELVVPAGVFGDFRDMTDMIDGVAEFDLDNTGTNDVATDLNAALAACDTGQGVFLRAGSYRVDSPIFIPPYVGLYGPPASTQVAEVDAGAVIKPSSSFAQGGTATQKAVICLLDQTVGGYSTTSQEQRIEHIYIDGNNASGVSGVIGIACYGRVSRVQLRDIHIDRMTGDGIQSIADGSGNQPDSWTGAYIWVRYCQGKGFNIRSADSNWTKCLATNTGDDGWYINTCGNTQFIGCRSEHAGQAGNGITSNTSAAGYHYICSNNGNSSGGTWFVACGTDQSMYHGMYIDGPNSGGSGADGIPILISGCYFKRDGQNSGTSDTSRAGIYVDTYKAPVVITGTVVWPGVNDDGSGINGPWAALKLNGANDMVQVAGCSLTGATKAVDDDGSGTVAYDSATSLLTGTTSSPSYAAKGVSAPTEGMFVPEDFGLVAWNMDPMSGMLNSSNLTAGTVYMLLIRLRRPRLLTGVTWGQVGNAASVTTNENFVGLYDSSGSRVAVSSSGTLDSLITGGGGSMVQCPFSSTYLAQPDFYYIAVLGNAGTMWGMMRSNGGDYGAQQKFGQSASKYTCAVNGTSQTSLSASKTLSSNSQSGHPFWIGLY